jgi:hemerythrin-like metal-binding protein
MYIEWSPLFETGVPRVDAEHKQLFEIVNQFHAQFVSGATPSDVFSTLNRLVRYVEKHFSAEEKLMELSHYPGLMKQRVEHVKLVEKVFALEADLERGQASLDEALMEFLKRWLIDHILNLDKGLEAYFQQHEIPEAWRTV